MTFPLISTKLGIPSTRPMLVPRQRLIERLQAGMHAKLSLISAPAGFGKTTLAAEWLRGSQQLVTWLSLDEDDNDPARFLRYLIAAIQEVEKQAGKETLLLLQEPQPPPADVWMTTLLNELSALPRPFVLALDDYHLIQTISTHQFVNFLVEHQPAHMHLVLITREDPPLPLTRLRARGQVAEFRQDDLRFTEQESAEFLENVMGLNLSPNDVAALDRRTEGWITGLQLAALSISSQDRPEQFVQAFTGSNRYVLDYLIQEVFERQTRQIQDFLLKTSILDRLCASLCDAVTGNSDSQELLEILEQANLFIIPLDQSRTWYRYHRLFRDLLRSQLHVLDESSVSTLHQRASSWYRHQDLLLDAINHALACADWENALPLIYQTSQTLHKQGEVYTVLNWYSKIPDAVILSSAKACLEFSWSLMLDSQFERADFYLSYAEGAKTSDRSFLGEVVSARAYMARAQGDHRRMVELSHQALSMLSKDDLDARCLVAINLGIAYWHSGKMNEAERALAEVLETGRATDNMYAVSTALLFQGLVLGVRGRLHEARDRFLTVVQQDHPPAFILGLAYLYLTVLYYEWNDLEQSGKYLLAAIKTGDRIHNDELYVANMMVMARLHLAAGNPTAAKDALEAAQQRLAEREVSAPMMPRLAAAWVQHAVASGNLESAATWVEQLLEANDCHTFHRFSNTTQALLLLAQNRQAEASTHLEQCFQQAAQEGWTYAKIAIRSLQSLCAPDRETAIEYLTQAMSWGEPEGFLRTFADLGQKLEPLLQETLHRRVMPEYAENILSVIRDHDPKPVLGQLSLVEPLNPRELEVLELLAKGYTNRQIAAELVISVGTVKSHVHNICGKLDAQNRTQAAARAHDLGLV